MSVCRRQTVCELWHQWAAGLTRGGRLQPVRAHQQGDISVHTTAQYEYALKCNDKDDCLP